MLPLSSSALSLPPMRVDAGMIVVVVVVVVSDLVSVDLGDINSIRDIIGIT